MEKRKIYSLFGLDEIVRIIKQILEGKNMRKENPKWEYNRETSLYEKSDYRSKFYNGKWEKAWLKEITSKAVNKGLNLYDAMWSNYADKKEHIPKSLFKFFPFNQNSIKCVETNNVFMNNPKSFNDPFDCVLCASEKEFLKQYLIEYFIKTDAVARGILTEEELNKLRYSRCEDTKYGSVYKTFESVVFHLTYDEDKQEMRKGDLEISKVLEQARCAYKNALEQLRSRTVGITSFANMDKFKLSSYAEFWAHYAQNHEGFCVEYDTTKMIDDANVNAMVMGGLLPCSYGAKQITLGKRKMYKYVNKLSLTSYEQMEFEKSIILSFLTKSSSWSYENEWRLILPLDICEIYRNMIPFFTIKAIYIGCRMSEDNREFMYRLAQRKKIEIYEMGMHEYRFELEGAYLAVNVEKYFKEQYENQDKQLKQSQYRLWKPVE